MEELTDRVLTVNTDPNLPSQVLYSRLFGAGGKENGATGEAGATKTALSQEALFDVLGKRVEGCW